MIQKRSYLIPCFLISFSFGLHANSTSSWVGTFSSNWTETFPFSPYSNWTSGVPGTGTPDLIAVFPYPGTGTIFLNSSVTLNTLDFQTSSNYTISGSGTVNWGGGTQPATLTGPATLSVPLNVMNVFGSVATISGSVTSTSGVFIQPSMTLVSGGSVQLGFLQGSNSTIQIEGGFFEAFSTSVDSSSQIDVNGGVFEFGADSGVGSLTVDSSSVNVMGGEVIFASFSDINFQNHSTLSVVNGTVTSANTSLRSFDFNDSVINQTEGTVHFNSDSTTFTNAEISLSGGTFIIDDVSEESPIMFDKTALIVTGGTVYIGSMSNTFQNQSSINVQAGSVFFNGLPTCLNTTGTISGGVITLGPGLFSIQDSQFVMEGGTLIAPAQNSLFQINKNSSWDLNGGSMSLAYCNIVGGTFNQSNGILEGANNMSVSNASSVNISGGTVGVEYPVSLTSSSFNISGGAVSLVNDLVLTSSSFNISGGTVSLVYDILLTSSSFNISNNSSYSTGAGHSIYFYLDNSFTEKPYFTVLNGDLDLLESNIAVYGSQVTKTGTYILFSANEITNYSISPPQSTSSVVWNGPLLESGSPQQIVLTATASSPPPHATLGSLASGQSLRTTQKTENMRDSRMRSSVGNTAIASIKDSRIEYLAQNALFAQQTPVELLGERAIQRPSKQWSSYFAPTGSFGSVKTVSGQFGNSFYTAGLMTGFDFATSYIHHPERQFAFGIGSTLYYTHLHAKLDHHGGSTNINQIYANIYGTLIAKKIEELSLDFAVGAGYDWHENKRTTGHFGSLTARSSTGGCEAGSFVGLEYLFSKARFPGMGNCRVIPLAYLQYVFVSMDDYREHGAGEFNLKMHVNSLHSLSSFLGARSNYLFTAGKHVMIRPEVTLGWRREYLNDSQRVVFSNFLAPSPQSASLLTIAPNRNTFIAGTDLYVRMYDWTSLLFNYQMSHNNLITDHSFDLEWMAEF